VADSFHPLLLCLELASDSLSRLKSFWSSDMSETVIDGIDYGPLACLIGTWKGDSGMDVAPEPDDTENNPYYETIRFEAAGDVTNAEEQTLSVVRYHQEVSRKSNDKVFHDQVGYWLWDPATDIVIQTLTIPRAVSLLAGGRATVERDRTVFIVRAKEGDTEWGIIQSPFMLDKARTLEFRHQLTVKGDRLRYQETTVLDIYGDHHFDHTDQNTLRRQ
jgi:hypothetical protein